MTELNWLSLRPRLRSTTVESAVQPPPAVTAEQRACGVAASAPVAVMDFGCAERYCQLAFTLIPKGARQRTKELKRWRWSRSE